MNDFRYPTLEELTALENEARRIRADFVACLFAKAADRLKARLTGGSPFPAVDLRRSTC